MKKLVCILLCLMLCLAAFSAFAAKPGDTVTVNLSVKSNPNAASLAGVRFSFDTSVLEFVSAEGVGSQPPQNANGTFVINNVSGIPTGNFGSITFKVKDNAPAGTYRVSVSVSYAYDNNEESVDGLSVSGGSVTVEAEACSHTWDNGTVTTEPTCEDSGVMTYTCTNCNETKQETISPTGHTPGNGDETVQPTCTEDGYTSSTCANCGTELDNVILPALGHDSDGGKVTKEPTCTEKGEKTYTCTRCGKVIKTEELAPLGHQDDGGKVTKEPTCTEKGEKTYTCTVCGEVIKTEEIPALGHTSDGGKETKAPNCTEKGVKTYTCTVCGEVIKTEEIPALGHKPGDWVVVQEATKEAPGLKVRYCTVCDAVVDSQTINLYRYLNRKVSTAGIHFCDEGDLTDEWFMFTPVDLSVEGEQTIDLVGANKHVIGKVYLTVADGQVTVKYEVYKHVEMKEAFLTFFPDLASVTTLEQSQLTGYAFDEAISIEEQLGGDAKVILYIDGMALYREDGPGLDRFNDANDAYQQYAEELKALMD